MNSSLRNGLCVRFCHQGILLPNGTCIKCPYDHVFNGETCVRRPIYCGPGYISTSDGKCIPTTPTCHHGEVLRNGVCVPIECPGGFITPDGRCEPNCPGPHYKWENGRCVPSGTVTCGPGYVKYGDTCVPIMCPPNTELVGNQCIMKSVPCPNGYEWRNNNCVPKQLTCGPGMVVRDGRCEYPINCGPDSESVNGKCVPKACPPGFERDNDGNCRWIVTTPIPPTTTCPRGFEKDMDGNCKWITTTTCPPGFVKDVDGNCKWITTTPPKFICPEGFIYDNGQCYKYPKTQPPPECPTGHTPDSSGRCIPLVCPVGTHPVNGTCIQFSCPPGFYYANNECNPLLTQPETSPPSRITNCTYTSTGHGCIDSQGGISTITNYNVIEHPTNISVVNVNTIGVYLGACKNGQIKTVVITGNGTETVDCEEDRTENEVITNEVNEDEHETTDADGEDQHSQCCNVVSPRVCEKRENEWVCFNRKRFRCGSFCTAKTVILSPSRRGKNTKD